MKLRALLLFALMMCTSCTALPREERAFAVALCVEKADAWRVHGRIPTYQADGGYLTLSGEGETLTDALSAMEAAAPMHIHLSQLRLIVLHASLAQSDAFSTALKTLSARPDMRFQCVLAMTDADARAVADALVPSSGERLSKAIDVLLSSHAEQGHILPLCLGDAVRMGLRQTPLLTAIRLTDGGLSLDGAYALDTGFRMGMPLTEQEVMLLALLRGDAAEVTLADASIRVHRIHADIRLAEALDQARADISLRILPPGTPSDALSQQLADAYAALLNALSHSGCDPLGLGRQAIMQAASAADWQSLGWPDALRRLTWTVRVSLHAPL